MYHNRRFYANDCLEVSRVTEGTLLKAYREKVIALRALQEQLSRCGGTGGPAGVRGTRWDGQPRGTNDPAAAAAQLADGLTAMARRQQEELNRLWPQVLEITSRIDDVRLYMIVHHYYVLGQTIEDIAEYLYVSPRTVARMKKNYLDGLEEVGKAAGAALPSLQSKAFQC